MNNPQKVLELANRISETVESLRFSETIDMPRNHKKLDELVSELRAIATQPSAEPAGDVDWNAAIEAAANEADHWQSRSGSGHECGSCIAGAIRRLARSQRQCGCGLDTCKESWEPGCGLGTSIDHAVPVEPQRQGRAAAYIHPECLERLATTGEEAIYAEFYEDCIPLYTEQPASAVMADVLIEIRGLLASKPVDCLGSGVLDYGQTYPIRDEVIDRITKVLAAAPDRSQSGGGA